jgi:hypothetical protein
VQSEQWPTENQVFEDEALGGAKRADEPREELPGTTQSWQEFIGAIRIQFCAKSFILQVYDVLARHSQTYSCFVVSMDSIAFLCWSKNDQRLH